MAIVCSCGWANDERPAQRASPKRTACRIVADGAATLVAAGVVVAGEAGVGEAGGVAGAGGEGVAAAGGAGGVVGSGWRARRNLDQGFTCVTLHRTLLP